MADLTLNFRVNDAGSSSLQKATGAIEGLKKSISMIQTSAFVYLGKEIINVTKAAYAFAEIGAKVKSIEDSYTSMAKISGIAIGGLISDLKRVTAETVDDSNLMKKATRLISEGFSAKDIVTIAETARISARLMGTDVSQTYDQIADSVVNLRERGLKSAGVVIDLDEAYRKHAKTLGVTKEELNDYGKRMALVNTLKDKNLELSGKFNMAQQTEYERIQKLNSAWKDFQETIGKMSSTAWDKIWTGVSQGIGLAYIAAKKLFDTLIGISEVLEKWQGKSTFTERLIQKQYEVQDIESGLKIGMPEKSQIKGPSDAELKKISDRLEDTTLSASKLRAEAELLSAAGKMPDWREFLDDLPKGVASIDGITYSIKRLNEQEDSLKKGLQEMSDTLLSTALPSMEELRESEDSAEKYLIDFNKQIAISKDLIKQWNVDDIASGMTTLSSATEQAINQNNILIQKQIESGKSWEKFWTSLSENISDTWSNNVSKMLTDSKNAGDYLKNIWKGIADSVVSAIIKMALQWLIFDNLTSKKGSEWQGINWGKVILSVVGGVAGIFGGGGGGEPVQLSGPTAEGGIFNTPQRRLIGETGPEAVIPLKGGAVPVQFMGDNRANKPAEETKPTANVFYIYALDPLSFRDYIRKNPEAIVEAMVKDSRGAGGMRGMVKNVG